TILLAGIDEDAWKRQWKLQIPDAAGLLKDVLARKIVPALLQNLFENHSVDHSAYIIEICQIGLRRVFGHNFTIQFDTIIISICRIEDILEIRCRDDARRNL